MMSPFNCGRNHLKVFRLVKEPIEMKDLKKDDIFMQEGSLDGEIRLYVATGDGHLRTDDGAQPCCQEVFGWEYRREPTEVENEA